MLVIECKNASKDEAIALRVDQIRRYHRETPEPFVSQQLFTATDAIGFSYGVSWNTVRRNIFNWKGEEVGRLEAKVKSFCAIPQVLAFIKEYIVFAEKDEELNIYILRQHQTGAVDAMAERARVVQENFENRQASTAEALAALLKEFEGNEARKKDQAEATPGACQELEILARYCPAVGEEFAVVKNQR